MAETTYTTSLFTDRQIINFLPDATFVIDMLGRVVVWNRVIEEMTGVKEKDILGKGNYEYAIPLYGKRRPILIDKVIDPHKEVGLEDSYFYVIQKDNSLIGESFCPSLGESGMYLWEKATALYDYDGRVIGAIQSIRNITDWKKAEAELEYQKHRFEALFKNSMDAIAFADKDNRIIDVNDKFVKMFGYTLDEIKYRRIDDVVAPILYHHAEAHDLTQKVLEGECVELETVRYTKENKPIDVCVKGVPVVMKGEVLGVYGTYVDITKRKQYEEKLKYIGMHDALTGLYNRGFFEENLIRLNTDRQLPLSIVMADINGLKLTNDAFGHLTGDKLLKKIASILKGICRSEDIICRLGGDEFAILLPRTQEKIAQSICNRIKYACANTPDAVVPLSISLGVSTKVDGSQNIQEVLKEAEERMYRNKMLDSKSSRSAIIASLHNTLREKTYETEEHSSRLQHLALRIGKELGMMDSELDELVLLSALHDIGKVAIPDHILLKKGKLTEQEWEIIKTHPEIGHRIAMATQELVPIAEKILSHHERWDGKGYPQGLRGEAIPMGSRILSIVDAFDVMTNGRPYRKSLSISESLEEIMRCAGTQFDPFLADIFYHIISNEMDIDLEL